MIGNKTLGTIRKELKAVLARAGDKKMAIRCVRSRRPRPPPNYNPSLAAFQSSRLIADLRATWYRS